MLSILGWSIQDPSPIVRREVTRAIEHACIPGLTRPRGSLVLRLAVISALVFPVLLAGCNRKSRLSVAPVHGSVSFNGQGVPRARVVFVPVDGPANTAKKRMLPFADTDAQGNFDLKTYVDGDGAPPGKYRVSIIGIVGRSSGGVGKDNPGGEASGGPSQGLVIPADIVKKFGDAETSGIEVTVQQGENKFPPFELKAG